MPAASEKTRATRKSSKTDQLRELRENAVGKAAAEIQSAVAPDPAAPPAVEKLDAPKAAETAAAVGIETNGDDLAKALVAAVKKSVRGVAIEPSKQGGKRYFRLDGKTLAYASIGKRYPSLVVGSAAPVPVSDEAAIEKAVATISERAAEARTAKQAAKAGAAK